MPEHRSGSINVKMVSYTHVCIYTENVIIKETFCALRMSLLFMYIIHGRSQQL